MTWIVFLSILKRIGYFVLDNWKAILLIAAGAVIAIWILSFSFGGNNPEPVASPETINKINTENEQRIESKRRESEAQTINTIRETDRKIREAESTPSPRRGNITGEELNKLARERK